MRPLKFLLTIHLLLNCLILPILHKIFDYIYTHCACVKRLTVQQNNNICLCIIIKTLFVFWYTFYKHNPHKQKLKILFLFLMLMFPHVTCMYWWLYCTYTYILTTVGCTVSTKHFTQPSRKVRFLVQWRGGDCLLSLVGRRFLESLDPSGKVRLLKQQRGGSGLLSPVVLLPGGS